jgi:hypothetical protein
VVADRSISDQRWGCIRFLWRIHIGLSSRLVRYSRGDTHFLTRLSSFLVDAVPVATSPLTGMPGGDDIGGKRPSTMRGHSASADY